ncbi:MAG: hypothetical protein K8R74_18025, partial [Bacteroidales bacterium]|nr:hypothetical protein [Bacteroidales bacterium]
MKFIYWVSISLAINVGSYAQYVTNPSFEGIPTVHVPPPSWLPCHNLSTPDTQPGFWQVNTLPSEGNSYMGMCTRGNAGNYPLTWEDCQTQLLAPLLIENCYFFSIDLALSESWGHDSFFGWISYNSPVILKLYGSDESCEKKELLWESPVVSNANWQNFEITLSPVEYNANYLIFEVYYAELPEYFGNMLVDNLQIEYLSPAPDLYLGEDTIICEDETLILDAGDGFSSYIWQDGSSNQYFYVDLSGIYWVEVTNDMGCIARD